ncbi:hormone-sensitive lipase-like [Liolophura sinensis]|uniref:hormone-sensitive lipase-like n=1 Tax=Liolophura sinensis TaxID=3198878 RepID=UPI0031596B3A
MEHFQDGKHSHHARFHVAFSLLYEHLELGIEPMARELVNCVGDYDLSPDVPANGYRSLLKIIEKCCLRLLQLTRHITVNRDSLFFRSSFYCKELEAFVTALGQLRVCLYYVLKFISFCDQGDLFAVDEEVYEPLAEELMTEVEMLNQDCFYGRCLAFQFCESMQRPLQVVSVAMASFGDGYQETSGLMQFASSVLNSGKYLLDPELRGKQVVHMTRTADVNFCKSFWAITETEIMQQLPSLVCPSVQVNELITLRPDVLTMTSSDGKREVTIQPPSAHTGPGPVNIRLISHDLRDGQDPNDKYGFKKNKKKIQPLSPSLLIHCHGGGFVAQSSKSHEVYLRQWARDLKVPIVSIDYSLAPENPFPRALEECFYAYAWILNNCQRLGSTGEVICLAGDSAGANLMISTSLKAVEAGIRVADGIMAAYTPTLVQYTPSPSRLLSLMDPLLPLGILSRCLAAYAGTPPGTSPASTESQFRRDSKGDTSNCPDKADDEWVYIEECSPSETVTHEKQDNVSLRPEFNISPNHSPKPSSDTLPNCQIDPASLTSEADYVITELASDCQAPAVSGDQVKDGSRMTPDSGVHCDLGEQSGLASCSEWSEAGRVKLSHQRNLSLDIPKDTQEKPTLPPSKLFTIPRTFSAPVLDGKLLPKCPLSPTYAPNYGTKQIPLNVIRHLTLAKNPFMSPLLAPDGLLLGLPPVYLVACHLDPILDDSVMFAKKLRGLGKTVHLHVIDDLPHGFLNFALVNKEAKNASDICIAFIDAVFHPQD